MNYRSIIQQSLPINAIWKVVYPELWQDYNTDYSVLCPFHKDTKKSLRIYITKNFVRCFGVCNRSWDPVGIYMETQGLTTAEAVQAILHDFKIDAAALARIYQLAEMPEQTVENPYEIFNAAKDHRPAYEYLHGRGIDHKTAHWFGVRGIVNRVLFPHMIDTVLTCLTTRTIDETEPKHTIIVGPMGFVPFAINRVDFMLPVLVCEGAIDAMTLWQYGYQAISLRVSAVDDRTLQFLSRFPAVVTLLDFDKAGQRACVQVGKGANTIVQHIISEIGDVNYQHTQGTLRYWLDRIDFPPTRNELQHE